MFDVFGSIKSFFKIDAVCIDNAIFKLHYKATFIILVAFSLIVTSKQYIGDPINCIAEKVVEPVINTFCWIQSTYTVPEPGGFINEENIYPGVGSDDWSSIKPKYHKYYQWVCFMLFGQAMIFYLPRYIWKNWEAGKMKALVTDLNLPIIEEDKMVKRKLLADYFAKSLNTHNCYAFKFFLCELLNFINVFVQIYFMDLFLDKEFTRYGWEVLKFTEQDQEERIDPMSRIFPKVTKCSFNMYGSSGTIEKHDALCILPLNIVNEKIYIFLWFWFILLIALTGLGLIYRIATICIPQLRLILLSARCRLSPRREIRFLLSRCQLGDWFVLYQLGKNIDAFVYREFISDVVIYFKNGNL